MGGIGEERFEVDGHLLDRLQEDWLMRVVSPKSFEEGESIVAFLAKTVAVDDVAGAAALERCHGC